MKKRRGDKLVGGLEHEFYFPINIGNVIIPIDELIFFRGVAKNHQPVKRQKQFQGLPVQLAPRLVYWDMIEWILWQWYRWYDHYRVVDRIILCHISPAKDFFFDQQIELGSSLLAYVILYAYTYIYIYIQCLDMPWNEMGIYNQQYDTWAYPKKCFCIPSNCHCSGDIDDKPSKLEVVDGGSWRAAFIFENWIFHIFLGKRPGDSTKWCQVYFGLISIEPIPTNVFSSP